MGQHTHSRVHSLLHARQVEKLEGIKQALLDDAQKQGMVRLLRDERRDEEEETSNVDGRCQSEPNESSELLPPPAPPTPRSAHTDGTHENDQDLGTVRTSDLAKLAGDIQQFMEVRWGIINNVGVAPSSGGHGRTTDRPACPGHHVCTMQEELGVKARRKGREWLMTRVPARLFADYTAKGALFTVKMRGGGRPVHARGDVRLGNGLVWVGEHGGLRGRVTD